MGAGGGTRSAVPEFTRRQLDSLPDPVFAAAADGDIVYWGAAAERTFGWPRELAEGSSCALLLEGVDRGGSTVCSHPCPLARSAAAGDSAGCGPRLGRVGWRPPAPDVAAQLHPDMAVARADGGRTEAVVVAFPAVLEGMPVLLHLLRESTEPNRDGLTGGLTRDALARAVADEQHRAARSGLPLSLALVDVDQLKHINDHWGHEAGDRALVEVADALRTGRRQ
ncbi:MAG: diguanylate cyclase, partial [Chloroflexi bacterium]